MNNLLKLESMPAEIDFIDLEVKKRDVLLGKNTISYFDSNTINFPTCIKNAFVDIFKEYNSKFRNLVVKNASCKDDYSFNTLESGEYINWIVQIDIKGIDREFIEKCMFYTQEKVIEKLKSKIFEIENNWAAYNVHSSATAPNYISTYHKKSMEMLSGIRTKTNKKVILLALTDEKYLSMLDSEFGLCMSQKISPDIVNRLTGFDDFWGAREFIHHVENINDINDYVFYVRSSDPVRKLKNPLEEVIHPLLRVDKYRKIIKNKSLTFNIDNAEWSFDDQRRINDTKRYMPAMGIADIISDEGEIDELRLKYGNSRIRAKPAVGSYGCYGHLSGYLKDKKFRYKLKSGLSQWGDYIIQLEYEPSSVKNIHDDKEYVYMDRVFCGIINQKEEYFGGQRVYIPVNSFEVKKRRLHIVNDSVLSDIY